MAMHRDEIKRWLAATSRLMQEERGKNPDGFED